MCILVHNICLTLGKKTRKLIMVGYLEIILYRDKIRNSIKKLVFVLLYFGVVCILRLTPRLILQSEFMFNGWYSSVLNRSQILVKQKLKGGCVLYIYN